MSTHTLFFLLCFAIKQFLVTPTWPLPSHSTKSAMVTSNPHLVRSSGHIPITFLNLSRALNTIKLAILLFLKYTHLLASNTAPSSGFPETSPCMSQSSFPTVPSFTLPYLRIMQPNSGTYPLPNVYSILDTVIK